MGHLPDEAARHSCYLERMMIEPLPAEPPADSYEASDDAPPRLLTTLLPIPLAALLAALVLLWG